MLAFLTDMVKSLDGRKQMRWDEKVKAIYSTILTYGGRQVFNFVRYNLNGPGLSTIERFSGAMFEFSLTDIDANMAQVRGLASQCT
jgi:hypothetical protein